MPVNYARSLTAPHRTPRGDRHLGFALAFVAGGANAGAFLAVGLYTSHMTGLISSIADHVALGELVLALSALGAVLSFFLGAVTSSVMIHYARRKGLRSQYALPLVLESALLMAFGFLGASLATVSGLFVPLTVMLLCFTMGLQNAVITKISGAQVRTTHLTGVVTDLGVEFGRLLYWNRNRNSSHLPVVADRNRLRVLALLCFFFVLGGVLGAYGFKQLGFIASVPLAAILLVVSIVPVIDELFNSEAT